MFKRDLSNIFVIILFGLVIYLNAVPAPFHFDDFPHIVQGHYIKHLANPGLIWNHWPSRFFGFFTFAVNYALGGLNTAGYRVVNIVVHLIGVVFAYLLVKLLVFLSGGSNEKRRMLAFWTAIIFACHPIQTQAVTYIVQRFVSMAGAFSLGAVFCYFQARTMNEAGARLWSFRHISLYGGGLLLALLAMASKESAIAIPVLVLSLELIFPRSGVPLRRRIFYFIPYALTFAVVPALSLYMASGHGTQPFYYRLNIAAAGDTQMYVIAQDTFLESRTQYLLTQLHAFLVYLRLSLLPARQSIWYDLPVSRSWFSRGTYFSLFVIASLLIIALRTRRGQPLITLAIIWFFFNLLPTSSAAVIWPFLSEHHLYLPVFSWALIVGVWLSWLAERVVRDRIMLLGLLLFFCLALLTGRRNYLWGDTYRLWQDALRTAPGSGPIYSAMAGGLIAEGRYEDAVEVSQLAIDINPEIDGSYRNLWAAYFNLGLLEKAETTTRLRVDKFPHDSLPLVDLGTTLVKKGDFNSARNVLEKAVKKNPDSPVAHRLLGVSFYELGETEAALMHFNRSVELNPDHPGVYNYLARAYKRLANGKEALNAYLLGVRRFPYSFMLNYNLASLAWELGEFELAERHLIRCVDLAGEEKEFVAGILNWLQSEMKRTQPPGVVATPG